MIQRMTEFIKRIGVDKLETLIDADGNIAETFDHLSAYLLPD
jgi:hypothetical protein